MSEIPFRQLRNHRVIQFTTADCVFTLISKLRFADIHVKKPVCCYLFNFLACRERKIFLLLRNIPNLGSFTSLDSFIFLCRSQL